MYQKYFLLIQKKHVTNTNGSFSIIMKVHIENLSEAVI
jgi:hypothetical protein